jgi:hypothetical protein
MPTQPLSNRRSGSQQATGCLLPFFALFFLAGCGIFYVALLRPGHANRSPASAQPLPE